MVNKLTYFILFKKKTLKNWQGAIPAKRGTSLASLRKLIRDSLSQRFNAKIITSAQLSKLLTKSKLIIKQKAIGVKTVIKPTKTITGRTKKLKFKR